MRLMRNQTLTVSLMLGVLTGLGAPMQGSIGATLIGELESSLEFQSGIETIPPMLSTPMLSEPILSEPILSARDVSPEELEGSWEITDGETPDDNDYDGTVEIRAIRDTSNLYNLVWETSLGDYTGLGFLEGDRLLVGYGLSEDIYGVALYKINKDGTLEGRWTYSEADGAVGTEMALGGIRDRLEGDYTGLGFLEGDRLLIGCGLSDSIYGVVLYKINQDGTLEGRWTYSEADGAIGMERAIGGIRGKLEGNYKIEGSDPGEPDSTYNGILRINKADDIYQVSWSVEDQILLGVGLRVDDWLIVGWGAGDSFAVMDYEIDGDKAKGRSAMSGEADTGKEKLRRDD